MDKETLIKKWLNHDLTPEERHAFEALNDYKNLAKLDASLNKFKAPELDSDSVFKNITNKTNNNKINWIKPIFRIAAILAICFSVYYFTTSTETHIATLISEKTNLTLPDASTVTLNSKSTLTYNDKKWDNNRNLDLIGEAFFKVTKGEKFTINTSQGNVTVLGTEFNVSTDKNYLEVQCFEGKVRVTNKADNISILTKGKAVRSINNTIEDWGFTATKPSWTDNESSYTRAPLQKVVNDLQSQYNIKVDVSNINLNQRYTGSFTHSNINHAFQTVFDAMEISYTFKGEKAVILTEAN